MKTTGESPVGRHRIANLTPHCANSQAGDSAPLTALVRLLARQAARESLNEISAGAGEIHDPK
jgi:hypothetical protein